MELLLKAASSAASYIFTFIMFEKMYVPRDLKKSRKIFISLLAATIMIAVGYTQIPVLNFLYLLISIILLNVILYKPKGKAFIIYDIILIIIMASIEMTSVSLLSLIINKNAGDILDRTSYTFAAMVINWLFLFLSFKVYMFAVSKKQIKHIRMQECVFFIILILGEILLLQLFNNFFLRSNDQFELAIILLFFLSIDLYFAFLLQKVSKAYQTERDIEILIRQSRLQLNAYKELNERYSASRKIVHDVRKHITSLEGLISNNDNSTAEKYITLLNAELDKLMPRFKCENPILAVIINDKLRAAEEMVIDFKLNIEYSEIDFISELDITIIFSNLLDNAFEACLELPYNKRDVQLTVARHNFFLFIGIENTFKDVHTKANNELKSTKGNYRGIGLINIGSAVEKYNGSFNMSFENNLFKSEILIPIPDQISSEDG